MAVLVNVGIDTEASLSQFRSDLTSMLSSLQSGSLPKIKVGLELDSTAITESLNSLRGVDGKLNISGNIDGGFLDNIKTLSDSLSQAQEHIKNFGSSFDNSSLAGIKTSLDGILDAVNQINNKDFNISNTFELSKNSIQSSREELELWQAKSRATLDVIEELRTSLISMDDASNGSLGEYINKTMSSERWMQYWSSVMGAGGFGKSIYAGFDKINSDIDSATLTTIKRVQSGLNKVLEVFMSYYIQMAEDDFGGIGKSNLASIEENLLPNIEAQDANLQAYISSEKQFSSNLDSIAASLSSSNQSISSSANESSTVIENSAIDISNAANTLSNNTNQAIDSIQSSTKGTLDKSYEEMSDVINGGASELSESSKISSSLDSLDQKIKDTFDFGKIELNGNKILEFLDTVKSKLDEISKTCKNLGINNIDKAVNNDSDKTINAQSGTDYYDANISLNKRKAEIYKELSKIGTPISDEAIEGVKTLESELANLEKIQGELNSETGTTKESINSALKKSQSSLLDVKNAYSKAALEGNKFSEAEKKVKTSVDGVASSAKSTSKSVDVMTAGSIDYSKRLVQINNLLKTTSQHKDLWTASENGTTSEQYNELVKSIELQQQLKDQLMLGKLTPDDFDQQFNNIKANLSQYSTDITIAGENTSSFGDKISAAFKKFAPWFSGTNMVLRLAQALKQLLNTTIEINYAMNQLEIVSRASDKALADYANTAVETAKQTASSITDIINSTTTYSRLGYSLEESSVLSKYTTMLQNVGDIGTEDAQNAITAIIKAFDVNTDGIESVMDKLVEVGNNFPISVSQIAEGLNNAGSALSVATQGDFDQAVALLTASNVTVQNISKASTALRTIVARLRNTKTELEELGEEPLTTAKYDEIINALSNNSVKVMDQNGQLRNTYDILKDLSAAWEDMSENSKAALAQTVGSTRNQNVFYSLMENFNEASQAMVSMSDSEGALTEANNTFLESTKAHLTQLKDEFYNIGMKLFDSDIVNDLIDFGRQLLIVIEHVISFVDALGGIKSVLPLLESILAGKLISGFITKIVAIPSYIKSISLSIESAYTSIAKFSTAISHTTNELNEFSLAQKSANSTMSSGAGVVKNLSGAVNSFLGVFGIAATVASIIVSIIQKIIDSVNKANEVIDKFDKDTYESVSNLFDKYVYLYKTSSDTDAISSARQKVIEALGLEEDELDKLIDKYGNYNDAVKSAIDSQNEAAKQHYNRIVEQEQNNVFIAAQSLNSKATKFGSSRLARSQSFDSMFGTNTSLYKNSTTMFDVVYKDAETAEKAVDKLNESLNGLGVTVRQVEGYGNVVIDFGHIDQEDLNDIYRYYSLIQKTYREIDKNDLSTNDYGYKQLQTDIKIFSDAFSSLVDGANSYDEIIASSEITSKLLYKDIGNTTKSFIDFRKSVIDSVLANEDFIGSENKATEVVDKLLSKSELTRESFQKYKDVMEELGDGVDVDSLKKVYGNIDLSQKQPIVWTNDNLKKYESQLKKQARSFKKEIEEYNKELQGTVSTVMGTTVSFYVDIADNGDPIPLHFAYTPMLTSEDGSSKLLDNDLISEYLTTLINDAKKISDDPKNWPSIVMDLDAKGIDLYGEKIHNLLANVSYDFSQVEQDATNMHLSEIVFKDIDSISSKVDSVCDKLGYLNKALEKSADAANSLEEELKEDDIDSGYNNRIENFEKFQKLLEEGGVGGKHFKAYQKYFGIVNESADATAEWIQKNAQYFADAENGYINFENYIADHPLEFTDADGNLFASFDKITGEFEYDPSKIHEIAIAFGWADEMVTDFLNKLKYMSADWKEITEEDLPNYLKSIGALNEANKNFSFLDVNRLMEYAGIARDEVQEILDKNPNYIPIEFKSNPEDINSLVSEVQLWVEQGIGVANIDPAQIYASISSMLSGLDPEVAVRVVASLPTDGEWETIRNELIQYLPEDLQVAVKTEIENPDEDIVLFESADVSAAVEAFAETSNAIQDNINKVKELNNIKIEDKSYSVTKYTKTVNLDKEKPGKATGTYGSAGGPTLLGDEFSADGSPKPELVVSGDEAYLAGTDGPVVKNLKPGDIVYPYKTTKRLLKNNIFTGKIPAYAGGTPWKSYTGSTSAIATSASRTQGSSSSSSSSKEETWFEKQYKLHNHYRKMEQETDEAYFKWLDQAWQQAYKDGTLAEEEAWKYQEEVFAARNLAFNNEYKQHSRLRALGKETDQEYFDWLKDAYVSAYINNQLTLDEFYKYQEEVYKKAKELSNDYFNDISSKITMLEKSGKPQTEIIEWDLKGIDFIEEQIAKLREEGKTNNDEEIQSLQKQWWSYYEDKVKREEDSEKTASSTTSKLIDTRIAMLKKAQEQERKDRKESLNKQLDDLKSFYSKQKELLNKQKDEDNYLEEQAEKRKKVSDLTAQLAQLEYDDSAWAQKKKLELEQELSDAKNDLAKFEKDYAIEQAQEQLDKLQEMQEKEMQSQIDAVEEAEKNEATPYEWYQMALKDIQSADEELYKQMIEYNREAGSGIDEDITTAWNDAYTALKKYKDLYGEYYKDIVFAYGTDQTKVVDTSAIDAGGNPIVPKVEPDPIKEVEPPPKVEPTPAPAPAPAASSKPSFSRIQDAYNRINSGQWGNEPYRTPNGRAAGFSDQEIQLAQRMIDYTYPTYLGGRGYSWDYAKSLIGYEKGTKNATKGLHKIDEKGSETIFQSSDGNKYKMFSGGEKVLNAKASNFLYDFANNGNSILSSLVNLIGRIDGLSKTDVSNNINMGDIIIQGNADEKTVSQIRREQRSSVDYMLKQINRLNKA